VRTAGADALCRSHRRGGFLIARAESLAKLEELLAEELFTKAQKMRFCRITEFNPVQHQPMLKTGSRGGERVARVERSETRDRPRDA
jgi:hypothetical protein